MSEATDELKSLVKSVALESIQCIQCSAALDSGVLFEDESADLGGTQVKPQFGLSIQAPESDESLGWFAISLRIDIAMSIGRVEVAYRSLYRHDQDTAPSIDLLTDFANEVAVMALIPYLREALADVTRRVFGYPLMMPMFQRGDLMFDVPKQKMQST